MGGVAVEHTFVPVSGLYVRRDFTSTGVGTGFVSTIVERVRLDVDREYPQMLVSGSFSSHLMVNGGWIHWIANRLEEKGPGVWEGDIVRRWGQESLVPQARVRVAVPRRVVPLIDEDLTLTFTGGAPEVTRVLKFESPYFRQVEFEFDVVETAARATLMDTGAHPDRPADLRREQLTIAGVYERAGVEIIQSPNASTVGLEPGPMAEKWTDQELHDAMRVFWSRYQTRAQWAMWLLFAHRHIDPTVGGIMFDSAKRDPSDRVQRQGAAVFTSQLAERLPAAEANPEAWIRRQRFFTAVHELGHGFNLLHSWEKFKGNPWVSSIPTDPSAKSFMNYPQEVPGFFAGFRYRFDDPELTFLRHAPDEFVQMGAAAAGQEHGFRIGDEPRAGGLALSLRTSRPNTTFEFLEPVFLDLTLTNNSDQVQEVPASMLDGLAELTLLITGPGRAGAVWRPYAIRCSFGATRMLSPGESISTPMFVSSGVDGWYLAEPGAYRVQAGLSARGETLLTDTMVVQISPPTSAAEAALAPQFFTDEVGRALAFGGTAVMGSATDALRHAADSLPGRAVARHAQLTLALPLMEDRKILQLPDGEAPMASTASDGARISVARADPDESHRLLRQALLTDTASAAQTFGRGPLRRQLAKTASWLHDGGDPIGASEITDAVTRMTPPNR